MLRLDGKDYFVPQRLSDVLRDNRYLAAPKPPGEEQMRKLILELEINVWPVVSPVPSKAIAQVGLRMIELLAPLR